MSAQSHAAIKEKLLGLGIEDLPTPSFIIKESQFDKNCALMRNQIVELQNLNKCKVQFRPHFKTHKTKEGLLKQLNNGLSTAVLVSTLAEAEYILADETLRATVNDICYTLPLTRGHFFMERLLKIEAQVEHLRVFIDNPEQVKYLSQFQPSKKWDVFLKIDVGTKRAGCGRLSDDFQAILELLPAFADSINLYGIYAHAGHSYGCSTKEEVYKILVEELYEAFASSEAIKTNFKNLVLSIGGTPTIKALGPQKQILELMDKITQLGFVLEIHCGNFCMLDLQQAATGVSKLEHISGFVLGSVVSNYKERNESLANTGCIALSRETSSFKGFGLVFKVDDYIKKLNPSDLKEAFYVDRVSQEHGILKNSKGELLPIGQQVAILPQHACIVASNHPYFIVVNDDFKVTDIWVPCKGW